MATAQDRAIYDVSFAGATVNIAGIPIVDFMDDANPIEMQEVELSSAAANCNNQMIRNAKPSLIMMSVTVIPNSNSDKALMKLAKKYRIRGGTRTQWSTGIGANITLANQTKYSYTNGTMISGSLGPTSNGEGKMGGRTYTFAFVDGGLG